MVDNLLCGVGRQIIDRLDGGGASNRSSNPRFAPLPDRVGHSREKSENEQESAIPPTVRSTRRRLPLALVRQDLPAYEVTNGADKQN
jgi:hypothetical protein